MAQASRCDEDERTGERRSKTTRTKTPTGQRKQEKRGGEALPRTNTFRKPIFCRHDSGDEEERPILKNPRPEENSTAVHGGGGVEKVQLKPIYMHIYVS